MSACLVHPHRASDCAGILFESSEHLPPGTGAVNLAQPGPRAAHRLWSALLESALCINLAVGAGGGGQLRNPCCCCCRCNCRSCAAPCGAMLRPPHPTACPAALLQASGKEGKKAAELAAALPAHLSKCLQYDAEGVAPKPGGQGKPGAAAAAAATGDDAPATGAAAAAVSAADKGLPPCVLDHRRRHGGHTYQLAYRLLAS